MRAELKAFGPFGGQIGDKETRKSRMKIHSTRNNLIAEVDGWGEMIN